MKRKKFTQVADLGTISCEGKCYSVLVFVHAREGMTTTSQERLDFIASQNGTLLGWKGVDQLRGAVPLEKLPRGRQYFSFHAKEGYEISSLSTHFSEENVFGWGSCNFEGKWPDWNGNHGLLLFIEN